jgi:Cu/Ag efflux pump CusA
LTVLLILIILYTMFRSFKWALLILVNVMLARIGGLVALVVTHTNFSVSSGVGMLALFGVSVQTGVIETVTSTSTSRRLYGQVHSQMWFTVNSIHDCFAQ